MLDKLSASSKRVVGTRRLMKAIAAGQVQEAYLAMDADLFIFRQVNEACKNAGVPVNQVNTMKALGEACHVQVPTASAGILK
ncbi:MAG: ribosomal L7Ae/L30e/S12e/Gadd45 family protein [Eubacteriales bacterium]|nr:ribosomal L7Ae/L30e/S12e/Gadd45 family protein [Eubacteriales bacterium]